MGAPFPLQLRLLALPTNIRLGWKILSKAKTLAYLGIFKLQGENCLIRLAQEV
jgi:hypothetical protein